MIFFLLLGIASIAQDSDLGLRKLLHGAILTSRGRPAAGVPVEIWDVQGIKIAEAVTDQAGAFELVGRARPEEYIFVVADSFQIRAQRVRLDHADLALSFALPEAPAALANSRYLVSTRQLRTPAKARAHLAAAQHNFEKMDFRGARREIDAAIQEDAAFAPAFAIRAFIELALHDGNLAREDARRAVALDANDAESFIALAMSCNSLGEFDDAEQAALHALSLRPDSWQARLELAKSFYGRGNFVVALRELDLGAIDFPDAHLVRGEVMIHLGRNREAATEFGAFLQEGPGDPRGDQIRHMVAKLQESNGQTSIAGR